MNTRDLMDFNKAQRKVAAKLLKVVNTDLDHTERLGDPIAVELNDESGYIYLIDENFNVALLQGEVLVDWIVCPKCHNEGYKNEMVIAPRQCCKTRASIFQK